jgi:isopentenyl diphosphate isomerase/L-lactate dehydrogenase-like FMN-dependent dehydrogenase
VKSSGFQTLVVSVDTPMKPYRERDMRNGISLPLTITPKLMLTGMSRPRWARNFVLGNMAAGFSLTAARQAYYNFETAMSALRPVTLSDIEWLRERWDGPLVVKGLLNDDKIRDLVNIGVDGVSVSNHGARNLDGVASAIQVLPRVLDTANGDLEVFVDGGIRRGIDAIRALALGANACLMGRPYMYGLAAGGQRGVEKVTSLMRDEIRVGLALLGCKSPADVGPDLIADAATFRELEVELGDGLMAAAPSTSNQSVAV